MDHTETVYLQQEEIDCQKKQVDWYVGELIELAAI